MLAGHGYGAGGASRQAGQDGQLPDKQTTNQSTNTTTHTYNKYNMQLMCVYIYTHMYTCM